MEPTQSGTDPNASGTVPSDARVPAVPQEPVLGAFEPVVVSPTRVPNNSETNTDTVGSMTIEATDQIPASETYTNGPSVGSIALSQTGANAPVSATGELRDQASQPMQPQHAALPSVNAFDSQLPHPVTRNPQQFFASDPVQIFKTPKTGLLGRNKFLLAGSAMGLVTLLGLGYVFGFYLPNKPANVFQTGLNRTGDNLTKLVHTFTEKEQLEKIKNTQVLATAEASSSDFNFNGAFDVKLSKSKSDGSLDIQLRSTGEDERKLNFKFLSDLPENKRFPNMYFQVNGLRSLGLDSFIQDYLTFDGKWIAVDSDYLESISGGVTPKNRENVTSEDVAGFIRIISDTTNEYLLTANKDKAVLENKAFIGKETTDGIKAFRYEVVVNKAHAKDYCKAMSERVLSHPLYKKMANLDDADVDKEKKNIDKDCDNQVESSIQDNMKLEMWVDAKYKLVHKLRIYENKDNEAYTELGQIYKGGDKISFFINYHEKSSDATFTADVDIKALTSKGEFTWKGGGSYAVNAKITFEAKPYDGEVKADRPDGAIDVREVLKMLGIEPPTPDTSEPRPSGTIQSRAKDTERQTDIKALHGQLEAYYAQYGIYPVIGNVNSASWRSQNMRGLDEEALKDPDGTQTTLAETVTSTQYGYATSGCSRVDNGCTGYTLSARLSDGTTYQKQNLN